MTTFVGTQKDFMDAIKVLIELDYAAVEAYATATEKLVDSTYRAKLAVFMADHYEHIDKLSAVVRLHGGKPPNGPNMVKQWLAKGKVIIAQLIGDKAVLQAMLDNEQDTNQAYTRMQRRSDQWEDAKPILVKGVEDEIRHRRWLEQAIASYTGMTGEEGRRVIH